jgi:3-methyladenine DNA glycosylase AlkD
MISTMTLIRDGQLDDAFRIAEMLLDDTHRLIHKAIGWVLRVAGDKDRVALVGFLRKHYDRMPRTALRYAIEHFSSQERKRILKGQFAV